VAKLKCRIYETPIFYHGRTCDRGEEIGSKDGKAALYYLVRAGFFDSFALTGDGPELGTGGCLEYGLARRQS